MPLAGPRSPRYPRLAPDIPKRPLMGRDGPATPIKRDDTTSIHPSANTHGGPDAGWQTVQMDEMWKVMQGGWEGVLMNIHNGRAMIRTV